MNDENGKVISLNALSNPNGSRIGGGGSKGMLEKDLKLRIRKEIDFYILNGDKLNKIQIANIMKLVLDQSDFEKKIQIHLHEKTLPKDASTDEIYYITPQVVSRFKTDMKIKTTNGNKTAVDVEDLLAAMIPALVRVKVIRMLDENAELSFVSFFLVQGYLFVCLFVCFFVFFNFFQSQDICLFVCFIFLGI